MNPALVVEGLVGLAVVVVGGYLATFVTSTSVMSGALVAMVFSGDGGRFGLPVSPDRLLFGAALALLALELYQGKHPVRIAWRPVHLLMAGTVALTVVSAFWARTLFSRTGLFAILDRLGVVPFVLFTLAPLLFRTRRQRDVLLRFLVVLGIYLGFTALFEGLGVDALVFPRSILNGSLGFQYGRARGPFLDSGGDGLGLFECAVAAGVAAATWRRRWARQVAAGTVVLCVVGTVFTLTRSVWLATALGIIVTVVVVRPLRWTLPLFAAGGAAGVALLLAWVPGLSTKVQERTSGSVGSVWDRLNTNAAAVRVGEAHPLSGLGWRTFAQKGAAYQQQAPNYPITRGDIEVHNVFLSHVAEIGIPGAALWTITLVVALVPAVVRASTREIWAWRVGLIALAVNWLIVASFSPLVFQFPNAIMWLWPGIVMADYYAVRLPVRTAPPPTEAAAGELVTSGAR